MANSVSLPLIDWDSLSCLSDGDRQFEAELLQLFIEDTGSNLEKIRQAIAAQDIDQVRRISHHLKGASANVGALSFSDVAGQLEQQARRDDISRAPDCYGQMEQIFLEVKQTIQATP